MNKDKNYFAQNDIPFPDISFNTLYLDKKIREEFGWNIPAALKYDSRINKTQSGCYAFIDFGTKVNSVFTLYAGTAKFIWNRIETHYSRPQNNFMNNWYEDWHYESVGGSGVVDVCIWLIDDNDRYGFEFYLIKKLKPLFNKNINKRAAV